MLSQLNAFTIQIAMHGALFCGENTLNSHFKALCATEHVDKCVILCVIFKLKAWNRMVKKKPLSFYKKGSVGNSDLACIIV